MNYKHANEVMARECGINVKYLNDEPTFLAIVDGFNSGLNDSVGLFSGDEWTIEDPRCREVIRNWWLNNNKDASVCFFKNSVEYEWVDKFNNSKSCYKPNEIACILAIVKELDMVWVYDGSG